MSYCLNDCEVDGTPAAVTTAVSQCHSGWRALLGVPVSGREGRAVHASSLISGPLLSVGTRLAHARAQGQCCAAAACRGIPGEASHVFLSITSTYGLNSFHLYIVCENNRGLLRYRDGHADRLQSREQTFRVSNLNPWTGDLAAARGPD